MLISVCPSSILGQLLSYWLCIVSQFVLLFVWHAQVQGGSYKLITQNVRVHGIEMEICCMIKECPSIYNVDILMFMGPWVLSFGIVGS